MNDVIKTENKICSAIFDDVLAKQIKNNLREMRNNKIQELEDSYNLANEFIECLSWDTRYFNSVRNSFTSFKII